MKKNMKKKRSLYKEGSGNKQGREDLRTVNQAINLVLSEGGQIKEVVASPRDTIGAFPVNSWFPSLGIILSFNLNRRIACSGDTRAHLPSRADIDVDTERIHDADGVLEDGLLGRRMPAQHGQAREARVNFPEI